jgi:hypothetical protein
MPTGGATTGGTMATGGTTATGGTSGSSGDGGAPPERTFRKITLSNEFLCEGANYGDLDNDGDNDIVAGPLWYEGPDFTTSHELYPKVVFDVHGYSDNFFAFVRDLTGDGWNDILFVGFPGQSAYWFENPADASGTWTRHNVVAAVGNESPDYTDITGDGEPELVYIEMQPDNATGRYGYAGPGADPREPWMFHDLSGFSAYSHFTHGMGVGDLDNDGRKDLIEVTGFWRQPASLAGDPVWTKVPQSFGQPGGAQLVTNDIDGDGDQDVVATLAAHGYGLAWFEQSGASFVEHDIVPTTAPAMGELVLHEPHALAMADIDGDGELDLVTGERHWGHIPENANFDDPARLYWFEAVRSGDTVTFTPHLVDDQSGVGTQVVAGDIDGDGLMDIVLANKKGTFLFLQQPD